MRKPIIDVCGAVIRRGSKILICGRAPGTKLAGYKEFPGGKAEPGETLSECLRREIREELGTEIYTLDTAYQAWVELPDRIFPVRSIVFSYQVFLQVLQPLQSAKRHFHK